MKRPLLWNNLQEAAVWLTDETGKLWTERDVLNAPLIINNPHYAGYDLAFSNKVNPYRRSLRTPLRAAMPLDTAFARYDFVVGKGMVRKETVRWGMVRLYPIQVAEILAVGGTITSSGPGEDLEQGIYVFIEPLDQKHIITSDMVRIKGPDLVLLRHALAWMDAQSEPAPTLNVEKKLPVLVETEQKLNTRHPNMIQGNSKPGRDIVDPVIDEAIERAKSMESAAVFIAFRDLILEERGPFTGKMIGSAFFYTNSENELVPFTKDALFKRLKRRRLAATDNKRFTSSSR